MPFDSILPEEIPRYAGSIILTTRAEYGCAPSKRVLFEDILECNPTVAKGIILQRLRPDFSEHDLIIGIDPGHRIGLSVSYCGQMIDGSCYSSADLLVAHIRHVLSGLDARHKTVKIGNGSVQIARRIADMLRRGLDVPFEIAYVDESGTSPKMRNCNRRGRRDMLSAMHISMRCGRRHIRP